MEEWIEARISVNIGKQNEVLLNFLKPLIRQLRSEFKISAYHFLHEPNNEIWFRVLTTSDKVDKIKGLISNAKTMEQVIDVRYTPINLEGHILNFGEDGWKTTYKFLEAGSDFALDSLDKDARKGQLFNLVYFSHLFFNQNGLHQMEEAIVHIQASMERLLVVIEQGYMKPLENKITQLESRINALEKRQ